MKRVKKWVALLLTAVMVMSMAGCGQTSGNEGSSKSGLQSSTPDSSVAQPSSSDTEDEKPYKGLHLKIWGFYDFATTVESDIAVYRAEEPLFHAINEWCLENECTWEWVKYDIPDTNLLLSAVASGNGPDLLYTYNHFPWGVTTGMLEPLDEYYDDFAETFSSFNWEDYALVSDGSFYGTIIPWGAHRVIQYDRTLFEELGVKTPMEYFMEGNWNWETFQTTLQDITKDTNGDGVLDTRGISLARLSSTFLNEVKLEEDGSISSTLNSERSRAFYNMIYEEYSVTGSIIPGWEQIGNGNAYYATGAVPCYTAMYTSNIMHYDVSQLLYADANGRVLETVPVPESP